MKRTLTIMLSLAAGTFMFADNGESLTSLSSWSPSSVIAVTSVIFTAGIMWNQHKNQGATIKRVATLVEALHDWRLGEIDPQMEFLNDKYLRQQDSIDELRRRRL